MGRTISELFHDSDSYKYGTDYSAVKSSNETRVEQEASGIRIKSGVELNSPLIYGNEATRITLRSTPLLDEIKGGTGTEGGGGGLIGGKITEARNFVNDTLGIPSAQTPTKVAKKIIEIRKGDDPKENSSLNNITPDDMGANGTGLGKFLKELGGGNPSTIGKQAVGQGIGLAKDKLRGALFGEGQGVGTAEGKTYDVEYTSNKNRYSDVNKSKKAPSEEGVKKDLEGTKLDLSKVSPIYGLQRDGDFPLRFGNTEYAMLLKGTESQYYSPENKDSTFTGITPGDSNSVAARLAMRDEYKLDTSTGDGINQVSPNEEYEMEDDAFIKLGDSVIKDFIPFWVKKHGAEKPIVFRTTITGLTETTTPQWSGGKFVGNPYSFYLYEGVERNISFNFKVFAANSIELGVIWEKLKILTAYTYPTIKGGLSTPPIIQFRLGDMYSGKAAFIESLGYTIPDDTNWETDGELGYLPKVIDVNTTIKFIESEGAEERLYDMTISKDAAKAINDSRQENADMEAERTNGEGDTPSEPVEKESAKKKTKVSLFGSKKVPSLSGNKQQENTAKPSQDGEVNPQSQESALVEKRQKAYEESKADTEGMTFSQELMSYNLFIEGYERYKGSGLGALKQAEKDDGLVVLYKTNGFDDYVVRIKTNGDSRGPYRTIAGSEIK